MNDVINRIIDLDTVNIIYLDYSLATLEINYNMIYKIDIFNSYIHW